MLRMWFCSFSIGDTLSELYDYKITDQHVPVRSTPTYRIVQPKFVELKGKQVPVLELHHISARDVQTFWVCELRFRFLGQALIKEVLQQIL